MKILPTAMLFAGPARTISLLATSPRLTNGLVPWYITRASDFGFVFPPSAAQNLIAVSPQTSLLARSVSLRISRREDLQGFLYSSTCVSQLYPTLQSFSLLLDQEPGESFLGVDVASLFRLFTNLSCCRIMFESSARLNWIEVCSLFSRVFTPGFLRSGPTLSLIESLTTLLRQEAARINQIEARSVPPSADTCTKRAILALVDAGIVSKVQTLMLTMFRSQNPLVNDGKSLPEFLHVLSALFGLKNFALLSARTANSQEHQKIHSFMCVQELKPTFDLIMALETNGDLMRDKTGVLFEAVSVFIGTYCFAAPNVFRSGLGTPYDGIDSELLIFMQRYGREMIPSLLHSGLAMYKTQMQDSQQAPKGSFINEGLRATSYLFNDAYWYDGHLETVDDVRRMIDVDGRKVLAHFPFEEIVFLLGTDHHHLNPAISRSIYYCISYSCHYLTTNTLLRVANENDCPEFVTTYDIPSILAQRLQLQLDELAITLGNNNRNNTDEDDHSRLLVVAELWRCLCSTISSPSPSPFVDRNMACFFGTEADNFPLVQECILLSLVKKTCAHFRKSIKELSDRMGADGFSKRLEECSLKLFEAFSVWSGAFKLMKDQLDRTVLSVLYNRARAGEEPDYKRINIINIELIGMARERGIEFEQAKTLFQSQLAHLKANGNRRGAVRREREDEDEDD